MRAIQDIKKNIEGSRKPINQEPSSQRTDTTRTDYTRQEPIKPYNPGQGKNQE